MRSPTRAPRRSPSAATTLLVLGLLACAPGQAPSRTDSAAGGATTASTTAIVHARLIDGTGAPPRPDQTLLIRDGRIVTVGPAGEIDTSGAGLVVDVAGRTVIPGLWDSHSHTSADETTLDLYLALGVTGVRDMGCTPECTATLVRWREEIAAGSRLAPRLLVSGPNVDGPKPLDYAGHVGVTVDSAEDAVADLADRGVDLIKSRDWLSEAQFRAVVAAAAARGLPVDGHLPVAVRLAEALEAMRAMEHGGSPLGGLLMAASADEGALRAELLAALEQARDGDSFGAPFVLAFSPEFTDRLLASFDGSRADALAGAFAATGTALVPTLIVSEPALQSTDPVLDGARLQQDGRMRFAPAALLESWREGELLFFAGEPMIEAAERRQAALRDLIARIHRAGAPILAGTDLSEEGLWQIAGYSLHDELLQLVRAGLTPMDAILAATSAPARVFGLAELGTLEPGHHADLVVLDADPLADIRNTRRIHGVMKAGAYLDRTALDELLEAAADRAGAADGR